MTSLMFRRDFSFFVLQKEDSRELMARGRIVTALVYAGQIMVPA